MLACAVLYTTPPSSMWRYRKKQEASHDGQPLPHGVHASVLTARANPNWNIYEGWPQGLSKKLSNNELLTYVHLYVFPTSLSPFPLFILSTTVLPLPPPSGTSTEDVKQRPAFFVRFAFRCAGNRDCRNVTCGLPNARLQHRHIHCVCYCADHPPSAASWPR
jgi:hypothetical protein